MKIEIDDVKLIVNKVNNGVWGGNYTLENCIQDKYQDISSQDD